MAKPIADAARAQQEHFIIGALRDRIQEEVNKGHFSVMYNFPTGRNTPPSDVIIGVRQYFTELGYFVRFDQDGRFITLSWASDSLTHVRQTDAMRTTYSVPSVTGRAAAVVQ